MLAMAGFPDVTQLSPCVVARSLVRELRSMDTARPGPCTITVVCMAAPGARTVAREVCMAAREVCTAMH